MNKSVCIFRGICKCKIFIMSEGLNTFYLSKFVCIYLTRTSPRARCNTKSIFVLNGGQLVWIQGFTLSRPVAVPRSKNPVCTIPYQQLGEEEVDEYLSKDVSHHHHNHDVRLARISLTLSLRVFLSFITFGRSSGLHPVSSHSYCMNVRAGRPALIGHMWGSTGAHHLRSRLCFSSSAQHVWFV